MPAPALVVTPPAGPFTYTVAPVDKNHFRISITLSQANATADWVSSIACLQIAGETASIPVEDRVAPLASHNVTIPFNDAPSVAAVTAKLQAYVDAIYDNLVPTP